MKSDFPSQLGNLAAVDGALHLAEFQKWIQVGKKQGYRPIPPGMYVQVATVARIVCDCGARFIWVHHAQKHYDEAHKPKPSRLHLAKQRIRWAWYYRSLKPLYTAGP